MALFNHSFLHTLPVVVVQSHGSTISCRLLCWNLLYSFLFSIDDNGTLQSFLPTFISSVVVKRQYDRSSVAEMSISWVARTIPSTSGLCWFRPVIVFVAVETGLFAGTPVQWRCLLCHCRCGYPSILHEVLVAIGRDDLDVWHV